MSFFFTRKRPGEQHRKICFIGEFWGRIWRCRGGSRTQPARSSSKVRGCGEIDTGDLRSKHDDEEAKLENELTRAMAASRRAAGAQRRAATGFEVHGGKRLGQASRGTATSGSGAAMGGSSIAATGSEALGGELCSCSGTEAGHLHPIPAEAARSGSSPASAFLSLCVGEETHFSDVRDEKRVVWQVDVGINRGNIIFDCKWEPDDSPSDSAVPRTELRCDRGQAEEVGKSDESESLSLCL